MALPEVVSREQSLEARLRLLAEEKKETRRRDALNTERRRLPMVRVEKEYVFEGPHGPAMLGPHRACSPVGGPASSLVPAVSCARATRCSTPIQLTDEATSTSPASIRCSI
jgi:hypothetical protein